MAGELDDFRGEAREILESIAGDLVRLEQRPDADLVNRIFRGAHSLKGLAAMLGFGGVSSAAHKLESVLDGVRMGRVEVSAALLDVLLEAVEVLGRMVENPPDETGWDDVEKKLGSVVTAADPLTAGPRLTLEPALASLLSDYENHRLAIALALGSRPWRIDVQLPFETFDTDIPALKERLRRYGEVITTIAGDLSAADKMGFGLVVVSVKDPSVLLVAAAIPEANIVPLAIVEAQPDGEGGSFEGFSGGTAWGVAELPAASASSVPATRIDWESLAREGEAFVPGPVDTAATETANERRSGIDRRRDERRVADRTLPGVPEVVAGAGASPGAATLRVNLERIDALMNLVGELVTAKNSLGQLAERLKAEHGLKGTTLEVFKTKRILERRLEELQKGIMQVRMLPMDQLFSKLTRVVRNLSRENGKEVELVVEGAETEIDKVMIDELSDPLIHIVRNAVDHGIEAADERVSAGKPAKGTIRITAIPRGNHVAIEIQDDGAGLDLHRIRAKGMEKGLLAPDSHPSEEEIFDLIFAAGFSTKEAVSEVSGRGVGMDVVRTNIIKLNGMIDTWSERGKGTRFTILLPLTLAIMKALVVGVAGQTYAIPLASILEVVSPSARDLRLIEEGREVLTLRESTLPLIRLDAFFGLERAGKAARLHVVVVGLAQYRVGFVVESLGVQQDVVVKPLGAPLTRVAGIMGATNLGNNRPVLVLDVAGVVNSAVGARPVVAAEA